MKMKKDKLCLFIALICAANIMVSCGTNENDSAEISEESRKLNNTYDESEAQINLSSTTESVDYEEYTDIEEDDEVIFDADKADPYDSNGVLKLSKTFEVIECDVKFDKAGFFSDGLCPYQDPRTGLWGYLDTDFSVAIKPAYTDAYCFSEGLAGVQDGKKWGFIDVSGKKVIDMQFDTIHYKYSFDTDHSAQYQEYAHGFIGGYARVFFEDMSVLSKNCTINSTGNIVKQEPYLSTSHSGNIIISDGYLCNDSGEEITKLPMS